MQYLNNAIFFRFLWCVLLCYDVKFCLVISITLAGVSSKCHSIVLLLANEVFVKQRKQKNEKKNKICNIKIFVFRRAITSMPKLLNLSFRLMGRYATAIAHTKSSWVRTWILKLRKLP